MHVLECDLGNTRCKWRLLVNGQVTARGVFPHQQPNPLADIAATVDRIRVVSVAADDVQAAFIEQLVPLGVEPEFAHSSHHAAGVRCAYDDPSRLGADRWLAAVAGFHHAQAAVLVLDAGTALKADLVDAEGNHLGGYIAPGRGLMKSSLLSDTGKVRFTEAEYTGGLRFGCDTGDAVNAGVFASQIGAILVAIDEAERHIGREFAIILTGGDAPSLVELLPERAYRRITLLPDLVLDGLQWVLP